MACPNRVICILLWGVWICATMMMRLLALHLWQKENEKSLAIRNCFFCSRRPHEAIQTFQALYCSICTIPYPLQIHANLILQIQIGCSFFPHLLKFAKLSNSLVSYDKAYLHESTFNTVKMVCSRIFSSKSSCLKCIEASVLDTCLWLKPWKALPLPFSSFQVMVHIHTLHQWVPFDVLFEPMAIKILMVWPLEWDLHSDRKLYNAS